MSNITINITLPNKAPDNKEVNKLLLEDLKEKKKRRKKKDAFLGASEFESPKPLQAKNYIK